MRSCTCFGTSFAAAHACCWKGLTNLMLYQPMCLTFHTGLTQTLLCKLTHGSLHGHGHACCLPVTPCLSMLGAYL